MNVLMEHVIYHQPESAHDEMVYCSKQINVAVSFPIRTHINLFLWKCCIVYIFNTL